MEQEIKDIIAKNLPAHVGDVLKKRLEEADRDKAKLEKALADYQTLEKSKSELQERLEAATAKLSRYWDIENREAIVRAKENKIDVENAQLIAKEANKRADELYGLVQMVFKSPIYRKNIHNVLFDSYDSQGRYSTTGGTPSEVTETID